MMSPPNKAQLRRKILSQRESFSHEEFQEKNLQICDRIKSWEVFCEAKTVLAYFSFRREPDLIALIDKEKKWGFPSCIDNNQLQWHSWQPGEALRKGKYGIKEPLPKQSAITAAEVDLIIIPTVACDRSGYRLGYGGGYYDRLLTLPEWKTCPTLGIVFDFAYLEELPREPWDMKLRSVCTEFCLDEY
ncbi:5,10-methenyltetrahydrofolate synthetase [Xenococcus sp. PCC 7305]|uniref:5-formyltetrahydrofolate cyclo-ligase n=1 Tax=Xenococcus sp. PCC 7305 TaxID=102125 RepID=UPI0002AD0E3B|nr:5-formyltetrahydrofolate cyclo-ligase [Xenococcus sp. PCC 7305]ELS04491.1 5,10-methenyltetrahydrofolate synthetase [Xenococcus sp. PCC 7305]